MQRRCKQCSSGFAVTPDDLAFYDKVAPVVGGAKLDIPPPTLCPPCRQQRRLAWRNERTLYHRKCDCTGKSIISNIAPGKPFRVYAQEAWWGDGWDAREYGRDFDVSRSFFAQYDALQREVPQVALHVWDCENCDFCNYVGDCKDCYLIYGSVYSQDCYYGSPYYSKDCVDTLVVRECERCYECVDCRKLHSCFYCQDCHGSRDLIYCYDLQGCSDCIACAGLRRKKFCIFNEQLTEAEFRARKAELDLCVPAVHDLLRAKLREISLRVPHRYMQSNQSEDVSGNYVYQCRRVHDSFYADRSEDCRFCAQVVDMKDCYDNNYCEENELCYEYFASYKNTHMLFSKLTQSADGFYSDSCHGCRDIFGCIGMRHAQYCILNKQYTKEEYERLVPKIVDHMRKTGEWGEFFPAAISSFGYNESVAMEYFPLERAAVMERGWTWFDEEPNQEKYLGPATDVPDDIDQVDDAICEKILQCSGTGKLFRVIDRELAFYRAMRLPVPKLCPNARHSARLALRNPRRLWDRQCAKCGTALRMSYDPSRPEIVYCDACYLSTIY